VQITVNISDLATKLSTSTDFTIEMKPQRGRTVAITKTSAIISTVTILK